MRVAVVGHVEWVEFLAVERMPAPGDIVEAELTFALPAGGGAVAAVALARWAGSCAFYTALGDDELGRRCGDGLAARGVDVRAAIRRAPQRRAITYIDASRDRAITTIGARHVPHGDDALPWAELASFDAVYVTGGDTGALVAARTARVAVATARILRSLQRAGAGASAAAAWDALVSSAADPAERYAAGDLATEPRLVVRTDGARGGTYVIAGDGGGGGGGDGGAYAYAAVAQAVTGDTYGAGDTFAAALTYALGAGRTPRDAIADAAARAAEVVTFAGPYPP